MKKIAFFCLFHLAVQVLLPAQTPEKYARVRIGLTNQDLSVLAALGIETDHGTLLPGRSLTTVLSAGELQQVQAAGFSTETLIPDLQAWHRAQAEQSAAQARDAGCETDGGNNYPTPTNYTYGTMAGYYRYQEMLDILDDMAVKFPHLISVRATVSDTITTHEGRPQWWVRVSDNPAVDEDEPEVLYTALHHAREPNSLSQMIFYLWHLLENYDSDPEIQYILNNAELYFIPCINPDGYLYNEFTNPDGYGYWRKNRRDNGDGSFGVDLNRNYGYEWGFNNSGSSPNPFSETYRGPGPFSEPETRMVRDFCLQHDFVFAFNYHTFSNLLIYPWGYSDALAEPALAQLAQLFVRENHYTAGVATETVGYYVNGTSDDWMYASDGTFAYTPEVGPGNFGFWPPFEAIDGLNRANVWANRSMALCALRFGEATDGSPVTFPLQTAPLSVPFNVQRYGRLDGPLTVTLTPLTTNVASVSAPQTFNLAQLESATGAFEFTLGASAQAGQPLEFLLILNNGMYSQVDTLRKAIEGEAQTLLVDDGSDLNNWGGAWDVTTETFVSAPTSLTDSPNSNYFPNNVSSLLLLEPVTIPADAVNPQLHFYARWEIEDFYDYAVLLGGNETSGYSPLCGLYTTPGGVFQLPGDPVYDGAQAEWVEERISLDAFVGQPFTMQISLLTNEVNEYDGFYFDDLRIEYFDPASSGTVSVSLADFQLRQNQPNPAADRTTIRWENPAQQAGEATLLVFNALGKVVAEQPIDLRQQNQLTLDLKNWPAGLYTYQIRMASWHSPALKLVKH